MKNSSKTTIRRTLSFILTLVLIFIPFTSMVSGETISTGVVSNPEEKLTENLKTYLETVDDDEYVPIYIWLTDYDEAVFYSLLSKRLGTTITAQTEEAYIGNKVAEKTEAFENRLEEMKADSSAYGLQATEAGEIDIKSFSPMLFRATANISSIMTDTEIENCLNSGMSSREIINLSQRNEFLSNYRTTRKALNNSITDSFQQKLDLGKCRNVSLDPLLTQVTLECKKSYVYTIASFSSVAEIGYLQEVEFVDAESEAELLESTTPAVITDGFDMFPQGTVDGTTYTGAGIKVGILEMGNYDPNAPHIKDRGNIYNYDTGAATRTHATAVVSILGGKPVEYENGPETMTYQGVAPGATIYFAGGLGAWDTDIAPKLEWMAENGCDVINCSWGYTENRKYYYSYEKNLDNFAVDYRILVINSAGNNNDDVSSPGMAYNIITVGNVNSNVLVYDKYSMAPGSSYQEAEYLVNKPDISAFGTKIKMLNAYQEYGGAPSNCFPVKTDPTEDDYVQGTSFSTPQVAGAAALVMQANPYLTCRPDVVKAILLGAADETAIATSVKNENGTLVGSNDSLSSSTYRIFSETKIESVNSSLKERSGAGLLNIEASIRMAQKSMFYPVLITGNDYISNTYTIFAGTTIEFGIVYQKITNDILTSAYPVNLEIQIIDSSGNVLFKSTDTVNNVEIFKATIQVTGDYRFKIKTTIPEGLSVAPFNATMFIFCGCTEKLIVQDECTYGGHRLSCPTASGGCGFNVIENHTTIDLEEKILSNGVSASGLVSCTLFKDLEYYDFDCLDIYFWLYPSSGSDVTVQLIETPDSIVDDNIGNVMRRKITYAMWVTENGVSTRVLLPEIWIDINITTGTVTASW